MNNEILDLHTLGTGILHFRKSILKVPLRIINESKCILVLVEAYLATNENSKIIKNITFKIQCR